MSKPILHDTPESATASPRFTDDDSAASQNPFEAAFVCPDGAIAFGGDGATADFLDADRYYTAQDAWEAAVRNGEASESDFVDPTADDLVEVVAPTEATGGKPGDAAALLPIIQTSGDDVAFMGSPAVAALSPSIMPDRDRLTEPGLAERTLERYGHAFRYDLSRGEWLFYNGQYWAIDDGGKLTLLVIDTARSLHKDAAEEDRRDRQEEITRVAMEYQRVNRAKAVVETASLFPRMQVRDVDLNADPMLLNTPNGTVDLRTGELRPHNPADMLTTITPFACGPEGSLVPPRFEQFLREVFCDDEELIRYVQVLLGLGLIAGQPEHLLPVFHGNGCNGKGCLIRIVEGVLGRDLVRTAAQGLLTGRGKRDPFLLADLEDRRIVFAQETGDGDRLDESTVKSLTGGDSITGAAKYKAPREFKPSHTIFLATNYPPVVEGGDEGIWRRLKLVPFNATIANPVPDLDRKIVEEEAEGILRWIVDGAVAYQRDGKVVEPAAVRGATAAYRSESDTFGTWLSDCCKQAAGAEVTARAALASYNEWALLHDHSKQTPKWLAKKVAERGFEKRRSNKCTSYRGFRLNEVS